MKYCISCGAKNEDHANVCIKCGTPFNQEFQVQNTVNETSKTVELVLGILGAVFGLLGAVFAIMFSAFGGTDILILGISALMASIVGLIGSIYVKTNAKYGGIILIISAIWLLISISAFGIIGTIFLGIAGILALVRK